MLSAQQDQAVRATGHCLVSSCPGSGKTTVLTHRAAFLLETHPLSRVCGVTFTADAATHLSAKIRERVPDAGPRLIAGTFHSLAGRQLRTSGIHPSIIPEFRGRDIIRRGHAMFVNSQFKAEETAEAIALYKSQVDYPVPDPDQDVRARVYHYYEEELRKAGLMDFSDLLLQAIYGMRAGTVKPLTVGYMLVDECQDADGLQWAWIRAHMDAGIEVTCVGDDDQSIYGWRHACGYAGMRRFVDTSKGSEFVLDTTYRCAPEILSRAAQLIDRNSARTPKSLQTRSSVVGQVSFEGHETRRGEIASLVEAVINSGAPAAWGILARTNALLDTAEEEIARAFPYTRPGGESVWDLLGPQLLLTVLGAIESERFSGIDTVMSRCGIAPGTIDTITDRVASRWAGSLMRFTGLTDEDLGGVKQPILCELRSRLQEWAQMVHEKRLTLATKGMASFLASNVRWGGSAKPRPERVHEEHDRLVRCAERIVRLPGSLASVLRLLTQDKREQGSTPGAQLLTLHASKGLEFERVWILGCEEGVIPSHKGEREEERRLLYVGMTRAKRTLMLSYCREDKAQASKFIEEAGIFI